jgi:hypothetical protein
VLLMAAPLNVAPPQSGELLPARRVVLARRVRLFVAATITYNVVEAVVAIKEGRGAWRGDACCQPAAALHAPAVTEDSCGDDCCRTGKD